MPVDQKVASFSLDLFSTGPQQGQDWGSGDCPIFLAGPEPGGGGAVCGREMQSCPPAREHQAQPVTRLPGNPCNRCWLFRSKGKCSPGGSTRVVSQPSLERSLFFSPAHTCGCQAAEDSKTDNLIMAIW